MNKLINNFEFMNDFYGEKLRYIAYILHLANITYAVNDITTFYESINRPIFI